MAKIPNKSGTSWTPNDVRQLRQLKKQNTPTRLIAYELKRTPGAVYQKASEEGISLKPTNQSPDKRRGK